MLSYVHVHCIFIHFYLLFLSSLSLSPPHIKEEVLIESVRMSVKELLKAQYKFKNHSQSMNPPPPLSSITV